MIQRIVSWACLFAGLGLAALAALSGYIGVQRAQLTYNVQGRYFDGDTVYAEQAVLFYAVMTLACALLAALFVAAGRWFGRKTGISDS